MIFSDPVPKETSTTELQELISKQYTELFTALTEMQDDVTKTTQKGQSAASLRLHKRLVAYGKDIRHFKNLIHSLRKKKKATKKRYDYI